jgi:hypothetical protein
MRNRSSAAFVLFGIVVGCVANRALVPPARAAEAPRWQYACFDEAAGEKEVAKMANEYGQQGWELVTASARPTPEFNQTTWCFKRPLL